MSNYLLKTKSINDSLGAIGQPLSLNDHMQSIFCGLSSEYDPFVCSILDLLMARTTWPKSIINYSLNKNETYP